MWLNFWFAVLVSVLVIWIPSYFAARSFGFESDKALVVSPLIGIGIMAIIGELLAVKFSIPANVFWIVVVAVCVSSYVMEAKRGLKTIKTKALNLKPLVAYIVMGIMAGCVCYVSVADTPTNTCQAVDMVHHIGAVRSFILTGKFSSLAQGTYMLDVDQAIAPWKGLSTYPSSYHHLVAIVAQISGVGSAIAINAVNFTFASIVFPVCIYALINEMFDGKDEYLWAGAVFTSGFTIFPWGYLVYGPLYPNMAAFAAMPALFAVFMCVFKSGISKYQRAHMVEAFLLSAVGLACLHPSAIFTSAIFLMPYCLHLINGLDDKVRLGKISVNKYILSVLLIVCWIGFFWVAGNTGAVRKMGEFDWGITCDKLWGWKNIVRVAYVGSFFVCPPQYFVAYAILFGIAGALYKKENVWAVLSYLLICVALYINATSGGAFKHFIGAFWYTDPYRFGAMASIFAIPLCAMGIVFIKDCIAALFTKFNLEKLVKPVLVCLLGCALWVTYAPVSGEIGNYTFMCGGKLEYSLGSIRERIQRDMNLREPYSSEEEDFVREIQSKIDHDDLIINNPHDGSMFSYGLDNLRIYYRPLSGYGDDPKEESRSVLIRQHLDEYATNKDVQKAVKDIDAKYVLQLVDKSEKPESEEFPTLNDFDGIKNINENTPGFKLVEKRGDMALYEIVR